MERNKFKVKYIRLNKPYRIIIQFPNVQNNLEFDIGEVYFKEYEKTLDIFYILAKTKKLYLKAINIQKGFYYNTIMSHINVLKTGHYVINANDIKKRPDGLIDIKFIDKLEEDIYGEG